MTLGSIVAGVICALGVVSGIKGVIGASAVEGNEAAKEATKGANKNIFGVDINLFPNLA